MNVGFYYMANAGGRLVGTELSGALYEWRGLTACLWASVAFVAATALISLLLPVRKGGAETHPQSVTAQGRAPHFRGPPVVPLWYRMHTKALDA